MRKRDELVISAICGRRPSGSGWVRGNCPFCEIRIGKPDRKQCLGLHVESGKWHCFRCGSGGVLLVGLDEFSEFRSRSAEATEERKAMEPPEGFWPIYEGDGWASLAADEPRAYLRGRGLVDELGREAQIGACFTGRLRGRVVVPIFDVDGETWLGWSARAWFKGAHRKYLYPSGMRRSQLLFNHRALHERTDAPALVVEGVFDALALWPDGVATLGTPSAYQVEAFESANRPVVLAFDGDAWRQADALARRLRFFGRRAGFLRLAPEVDPDEVPREEIDRRALACLDAT